MSLEIMHIWDKT